MSKETCPRCGSEDLIDWGTKRRMCRRCHEVFVVDEPRLDDEAAEESNPSERAQTFLEELRSRRLERPATTNEPVTIPEVPPEVSEPEPAPSPEPQQQATEKFERFYTDLKAKQRARDVQRATASASVQKATVRKKTPAKAAGWVAVAAVIWVLMTLLCSLREC